MIILFSSDQVSIFVKRVVLSKNGKTQKKLESGCRWYFG